MSLNGDESGWTLTKRQEAELEVADVWIVIGNEQNVRIRCEYFRRRAQVG